MADDRNPQQGSDDPDTRAFGGGADTPPQQPDQPVDGNRQLLRDEAEDTSDEGADAPPAHGDYGNLPGYGG